MGSPSSTRRPNWRLLIEEGLPPFVALWRIDLDALPAEIDSLSFDERERAAKLRFPLHRQRFIAGRAALRALLGEHLGLVPASLLFRYNEFGKPSVTGIEFNLAHSENLALIAIAPCPVGVDLEFRRPVEFDLLAKNVFSPAELNIWRTLAPGEKPRAFYALWTRKEALLKGIGCGIAEKVQHLSAFFESTARVEGAPEWKVHSFDLPENFAAAVACRANLI